MRNENKIINVRLVSIVVFAVLAISSIPLAVGTGPSKVLQQANPKMATADSSEAYLIYNPTDTISASIKSHLFLEVDPEVDQYISRVSAGWTFDPYDTAHSEFSAIECSDTFVPRTFDALQTGIISYDGSSIGASVSFGDESYGISSSRASIDSTHVEYQVDLSEDSIEFRGQMQVNNMHSETEVAYDPGLTIGATAYAGFGNSRFHGLAIEIPFQVSLPGVLHLDPQDSLLYCDLNGDSDETSITYIHDVEGGSYAYDITFSGEGQCTPEDEVPNPVEPDTQYILRLYFEPRMRVDTAGVGAGGPNSESRTLIEGFQEIRIKFKFTAFDVDIDSDNTNPIPDYGPDHTIEEDVIEEEAPGRYIQRNYDDDDNDGILDYQDGYNCNGVPGDDDDYNTLEDDFVRITMEIPPDWDAETGFISIYADDCHVWKKAGHDTTRTIDDRIEDCNDDCHSYAFLMDLGFSETVRTIDLWLEGIQHFWGGFGLIQFFGESEGEIDVISCTVVEERMVHVDATESDITITYSPAPTHLLPAGTETIPFNLYYPIGTTYTLTAPDSAGSPPMSFSWWEVNGIPLSWGDTSLTRTVDDRRSNNIKAVYGEPEHVFLTINSLPPEVEIEVDDPLGNHYLVATPYDLEIPPGLVTVTAPQWSPDYQPFGYWSIDGSVFSHAREITVLVLEDTTLTANYAATRQLSIHSSVPQVPMVLTRYYFEEPIDLITDALGYYSIWMYPGESFTVSADMYVDNGDQLYVFHHWAVISRSGVIPPEEGETEISGIMQETAPVQIRANYILLGDVNDDGGVNSFDIDPFVKALTYGSQWFDTHPGYYWAADCNKDGMVNAFDIDPFVEILTGE